MPQNNNIYLNIPEIFNCVFITVLCWHPDRESFALKCLTIITIWSQQNNNTPSCDIAPLWSCDCRFWATRERWTLWKPAWRRNLWPTILPRSAESFFFSPLQIFKCLHFVYVTTHYQNDNKQQQKKKKSLTENVFRSINDESVRNCSCTVTFLYWC